MGRWKMTPAYARRTASKREAAHWRQGTEAAQKVHLRCSRRKLTSRIIHSHDTAGIAPMCPCRLDIKTPLLHLAAKERSFYLILWQSCMAYTEYLLQDHQLVAAFLLQNLCHVPA